MNDWQQLEKMRNGYWKYTGIATLILFVIFFIHPISFDETGHPTDPKWLLIYWALVPLLSYTAASIGVHLLLLAPPEKTEQQRKFRRNFAAAFIAIIFISAIIIFISY